MTIGKIRLELSCNPFHPRKRSKKERSYSDLIFTTDFTISSLGWGEEHACTLLFSSTFVHSVHSADVGRISRPRQKFTDEKLLSLLPYFGNEKREIGWIFVHTRVILARLSTRKLYDQCPALTLGTGSTEYTRRVSLCTCIYVLFLGEGWRSLFRAFSLEEKRHLPRISSIIQYLLEERCRRTRSIYIFHRPFGLLDESKEKEGVG